MAITMETIARRLGVSKVTVSNALRGNGRVSAVTRKKVLRAAEQLGYRPNPLVTALMSDLRRKRSARRCTLAFLNFFPGRDDWRDHPTFVHFHRGAQRRAEELGYKLESHWQGEVEGNGKRLGGILYARGIPGLVLAPLPTTRPRIALEWSRFATVAIGNTFQEFHAHRVSNHQFHSVRLAVDRLVERGFRRIALVMPRQDDDKVEHMWMGGFISAQLHHGLPPIPPLVTPDFNAGTVLPWLRQNAVQAVVGTNHYILRWLPQAGLRVPADLSFVHLDWSEEKGALAGVDQCSDRIGAAAVDLVVEQLNNNEIGVPAQPKTVMIDGVWHDGPTLGSPAAETARPRAPRVASRR